MITILIANIHWSPSCAPDTILNTCINRLNPHNNSAKAVTVIVPILQMRKLWQRGEDKGLNPRQSSTKISKVQGRRHVSESVEGETSQKNKPWFTPARAQKSPPRLSFKGLFYRRWHLPVHKIHRGKD